jgi:hypothetical protein
VDQGAVGIDDSMGPISNPADLSDHTIPHGDVGGSRRVTTSVDHPTGTKDQIMNWHAGSVPWLGSHLLLVVI